MQPQALGRMGLYRGLFRVKGLGSKLLRGVIWGLCRGLL